MENKTKWIDIIVGWESVSKDGNPYLQLAFNEDFSIKKGEKLFLNLNKFADKNSKAPKWKKSKKIEDDSTSLENDFKKDLDGGLPF